MWPMTVTLRYVLSASKLSHFLSFKVYKETIFTNGNKNNLAYKISACCLM